jgi:hypothetical protein
MLLVGFTLYVGTIDEILFLLNVPFAIVFHRIFLVTDVSDMALNEQQIKEKTQ